MGNIIDGLNPEQREAVSTLEGPLLVLAGAGTGKTRVITCRIAYMIEQGIDPSSILGVTFTNKAAKEMRERLAKLVKPADSAKVTLGTFHSFCARILRKDISLAGNYNSSFSIADQGDQLSLIRQAAAELGISKDEVPTQEAANYISRCKNKMMWPQDALNDTLEDHPGERVLAEIYERYQTILELQNTLDFDDMLMLALKILLNDKEALERYRDTYRYLLVDEYQDTNAAQFKILKMIAGERANICVVGDDDQSIYAWRGADISNILDFPSYFPGAKEIKLEQNYRSTNKILESANAVIGKNSMRYRKNLWSAKGDGENLRIFRLGNEEAEAKFVVDAIKDMMHRNPDMCLSDFAILYRSNYLSRTFEQEFRRRGIRPKVIGGQEFFQRKEVKDAAAYLKLILNPRDDQSLLRILSVPSRGIGDKAIEHLRHMQKVVHRPLTELLGNEEIHDKLSSIASRAAKGMYDTLQHYRTVFAEPGGLAGKAREYLDEIGYLNGLQRVYRDLSEAQKRKENVEEFINYIAICERNKIEGGYTLTEFMENYSLMDDSDRTENDDDYDGPIMTTVHAAKGLEFPCVFIVGMEQGLFPHERALMEGSEEEERRLFYVAITRAREYLFLSLAKERYKYKEYVKQAPSKFLRDIPDDLADKPDLNEYFVENSSDEKLAAFAEILRQLRKS